MSSFESTEQGLCRTGYFVHWYVSHLEERNDLVYNRDTSLLLIAVKKKHLLFYIFFFKCFCTFIFQSDLLSNSATNLDRCATDKIMGAINYNEAMMLRLTTLKQQLQQRQGLLDEISSANNFNVNKAKIL